MRLVLETGDGKASGRGQHAAPLNSRLSFSGWRRGLRFACRRHRSGAVQWCAAGSSTYTGLGWRTGTARVWGDDIESLRTFDLDSQRSATRSGRVTISAGGTEGRGDAGSKGRSMLPPPAAVASDLLPSDALVVLEPESRWGRKWSAPARGRHHLEVARTAGRGAAGTGGAIRRSGAWQAQLAGSRGSRSTPPMPTSGPDRAP